MIAPDAADSNRAVELLKVLKLQHVEVQQLSRGGHCSVAGEKRGDKPKRADFPAGSIVVRMDQPYSRVADALLDRQYWAPDDPQKHPYDDTGWSFSQLFNREGGARDRCRDSQGRHDAGRRSRNARRQDRRARAR